ncbi:hypothetical protein J4E86_003992 [Alternaria arbusti]|uniref:uncharacterized protein n=1 Tax=Alternaria arbusti TaxID=232088 RepID=UPI0022203A2C|nr:uncharacterized protein J4E86_003992 [Alternaria arbusti]KAI4958392.1 hypothetical protein J4E86_003992 [Alternaria arbusti]
MASPPFMVESAEIDSCWEQLRKLLKHEYEQTALNEIQQSVNLHEGLDDILHLITDADGSPIPTIDSIKSNLGVARDVNKDIKEATKAYNVAVCRTIGPAVYGRLPRELRDMIYEYLTTRLTYICFEDVKFVLDNANTYSICPEHYWRADVIGSEVAHELRESWYRDTTFYVERDQSTEYLVSKDYFNAGLEPRELITDLIRRLWIEERQTEAANAQILRYLDELFLLRTVTHLCVDLNMSNVRLIDKGRMFRGILQLIRPTILRLRRSGYQCKITTSDDRFGEGMFLGTIKQWEDELGREIERGDSTARSGV